MAAWSFPKKGESVESTARPLSVESLDGCRVRGRLSVRFDRPLAVEVAERVAAEIVSVIAAVVGEEICEGTLPFTGDELVARTTARARSLSPRVSGFQVSALEVADVTSRAPHHGARSVPAPSPGPSAPPGAASVPAPASRGGKSSGSSGVMQAVGSSRAGAAVVPGAIRTLWPRVLAAGPSASAPPHAPVSAARMGRLFAPALRDSTAAALFAMLGAVDPSALDRLEFLESRGCSPVLSRLRGEACACLASAFHRILVGAALDPRVAREVAETAYAQALAPESPPAADIQRYLASPAPLRDLAQGAAAAFGAPEDTPRLFAALSAYGSALRTDLVTAAANVKRRHDEG